MVKKQGAGALFVLLLFITACTSASDGDVDAAASEATATPAATATATPNAAAEPTTPPEPPATQEATAVPRVTLVPAADPESEAARAESLQLILNAGGFSDESANCALDKFYELFGSYNLRLDPGTDPERIRELDGGIVDCREVDLCVPIEPPPSNLTIEQWRQGSGALPPVERNGVYAGFGYPPMTIDATANYHAVITTDAGAMRLQLDATAAPIAVNNFVNLAADGYYDGLTFHRVIDEFMAQAGDPSGLGSGGPGYAFPNECIRGENFTERGIIAMANKGRDTNGGQFFIMFGPYDLYGVDYTIFGQLVEGDDVLAAVDLRDPDQPGNPPGTVIESIRIEVS